MEHLKTAQAAIFIFFLFTILSFAAEKNESPVRSERADVSAEETITGRYCYTHGDGETLQEAREITRTLAVRNAIESYRVFVESSAKITNFTMANDIVQLLTSGYLKNITSLSHTEQGRTVCDTLQAKVNPSEMETFIRREAAKRARESEERGVDSNECLKILSAQLSDGAEYARVVVKALRDADSALCSVRYRNRIYVDYFDAKGDAYDGAWDSAAGLTEGEIKAFTFAGVAVPKNGTFRVRVRK